MFFDAAGRFIMVHFKHNGSSFGIASVCAPNRNPDSDDFFDFCIDKIDPVIPTLICGDFNTVFDRSLDRRGSHPFDSSHESSVNLVNLFSRCCVTDVWRSLHPSDTIFTWLKPDGSFSSHIDLVGCPVSWLHLVSSCNIVPCPFLDHSGVVLQCAILQAIPRVPGRWKLNFAILKDDDFVASVKRFWQGWRSKNNS